LPFDSCSEFVNYLVGLATEALKSVQDPTMLELGNASFVAENLGASMMHTARFQYERHIHNRFDGFKSLLVDPGGQGAGVYGHILGVGGATLLGGLGGFLIVQGNSLKDRYQASSGTDGGQGPAEKAGNEAGIAVGNHMWNFISGRTPREVDRLRNSLTSELCN
jgi:hypothetical protein